MPTEALLSCVTSWRETRKSSFSRVLIFFSASSKPDWSLLLSSWERSYILSVVESFRCKSRSSSWRLSAPSLVPSIASPCSCSLLFKFAISSWNDSFSWWQCWCAITISDAFLCVSNSSLWRPSFSSSLSLQNLSSSRYLSVLVWSSFLKLRISCCTDSRSVLPEKRPSTRSCLNESFLVLKACTSFSASAAFFFKNSSSCCSTRVWTSLARSSSCSVHTRLCAVIISLRTFSFSSSHSFSSLSFSSSSSLITSSSCCIPLFSLS